MSRLDAVCRVLEVGAECASALLRIRADRDLRAENDYLLGALKSERQRNMELEAEIRRLRGLEDA